MNNEEIVLLFETLATLAENQAKIMRHLDIYDEEVGYHETKTEYFARKCSDVAYERKEE